MYQLCNMAICYIARSGFRKSLRTKLDQKVFVRILYTKQARIQFSLSDLLTFRQIFWTDFLINSRSTGKTRGQVARNP